MKTVKLTIDNDPDTENPCEQGGWVVHSFGRRHSSFAEPSSLGLGELDEFGEPKVHDIGLRRKLDAGTAFLLSYFEHGNCTWSLKGEGTQCRWDSVRVAGLLVWSGSPKDCGYSNSPDGKWHKECWKTDYESREKNAREFLKAYTEWCNGSCYCYSLVEYDEATGVEGEHVDSCSGYIGDESLVSAIKEAVKGNKVKVVEVTGDAEWLSKYHVFNEEPKKEPVGVSPA